MVGALWIDSGSESDTNAQPRARRSRQPSHSTERAARPSRTSPRQRRPRSPGSTSVIVLSSSQNDDAHSAAPTPSRLPSTSQDGQAQATELTHSQRMASLMSQSSPDSSLSSFRGLLAQHSTRGAASRPVASFQNDTDTAAASNSHLLPASSRAGSLRRTASQPVASSPQQDPPASHRVRSARTPVRNPRTSTVHEVIELDSDSIADPASEADIQHCSPNSSPIRSQFSTRHLPSSSLPIPVSPLRAGPTRASVAVGEPADTSVRPPASKSLRQTMDLRVPRSTLRVESAPIVILSSSPPPASLPRASQAEVHLAHMDDELFPDLPPSSFKYEAGALPSPPSSPCVGEVAQHDTSPSINKRTAASTSKLPSPKRARPLQRTTSLLDALDNLHVPKDTVAKASKAVKVPEEGNGTADVPPRTNADDGGASHSKSTSKAAKAAAAKEAREAKAREREAAKAAKARLASEKKRFVEANRLRTSKSDTMRELIVDLDRTLFAKDMPLATCEQSIVARLVEEGATVHMCDSVVAPPLIRFRRKVKAEWSDERRHWVPLDEEQVRREPVTMVYVDAAEVVRLVGEGETALEAWYADLERRLLAVNAGEVGSRGGEQQVFLICQGLVKYYSRLRANENRAYTARIRQQLAEGSNAEVAAESTGTRAAGRKGAGSGDVPVQAVVERALLQLKMMRRCYVIHAASLVDGVEWVHQLTGDVSLRPYKALRDTHLSFAVDTGRNTTSNDPGMIYAMMLQQIPRVTPAIAASIATRYPSLHALVAAYKSCTSVDEERRLLATIQIETNRDGTVRSANRASLGLQLSKRIHAVLRGSNAEMLINRPTKD
ncbi:hypothetical protein PANT_2d00056 [Moesziomyces antarcticus T-34]|uniref:ERCC4 domain-containing protein n=1 Tax=Pseudozyma antarctica (strain T-34) TaxID=1151754 RepID=M9LJ56_PSEA3|nr:hypothetical protein PANT_2d00056 [Moesziomyces antarcticus T-34]